MTSTIIRRGPDCAGHYLEADQGLYLGHRRLSILDLSPLGTQPMQSKSERYIIVYNGEIYNFRDLKAELGDLGHTFRGESDTEVLLAALDQWGPEEVPGRLNGMFAYAVWDRQDRSLWLVRDHVGIKPLYWGRQDGLLAFGSQPKVIIAHPHWRRELNGAALQAYLGTAYVPSPLSIFRDIQKVSPGHWIRIDADGAIKEKAFWSPEAAAHRQTRDGIGSDEMAIAELDGLLSDAVKRQMVADVPLGAFLSGGIDSSTVVALMQKQSSAPVKTFTIGFEQEEYNEADGAAEVAQHLGTDHHCLMVTSADALSMVDGLSDIYDEPFADSSQIPTLLVSEMTRRHVTVALSGDGGDELFGGYNRYLAADRLARKAGATPQFIRHLLAGVLTHCPPSLVTGAYGLVSGGKRLSHPEDKVRKLARIIGFKDNTDLYRRLTGYWFQTERLLGPRARSGLGAGLVRLPADRVWDNPVPGGASPSMQLADMLGYLPDDILTKVDRASMHYSLESRVPLLDYRCFDFSWRLREDQKIRQGEGKWILRQVLYKYVPQSLLDRPKQGFSVPMDYWLREPLRDWAEDLLSERSLSEIGLFETAHIRQAWQLHQSGTQNLSSSLWCVLMAQSWANTYLR